MRTKVSIFPKLSRNQIGRELKLLIIGNIRGGRAYRQHISVKRLILERDNYTCQVCGAPARDVDHVIPYWRSHNGMTINMRALCHPCNLVNRRHRQSQALDLDTFYANPFKTQA